MRVWWLSLVLLGACMEADPSDIYPDPIDWTDFMDQSTVQKITGTDRFIRLSLQVSLISGTPTIEYQLEDEGWKIFSPTAAASIVVAPRESLQFRVSGTGGDSASITVSNVSTGDTLVDTVSGTVQATAPVGVTGDGTVGSPYIAPGPPPASCRGFLISYPEQQGRNGIYHLEASKPLDAYCDMTTDDGGWTLVARVLANSTTHVTTGAIGTLTWPMQTTTAKYDDATINSLRFTTSRIALEATGTVYAKVSSLDLGGTAFNMPNVAAPALAGPYMYALITMTTCSSDCGIAVVNTDMGFGRMCGYRYYVSQGNPRDGMGCQGAPGKAGAVWVK